MEVASGPDYEVAIPRRTTMTPFMGATPQMGDSCDAVVSTLGGSNVSHDTTMNAAACVGEKINNLRTLAKRNVELNWTFRPFTASGPVLKPFQIIAPFTYPTLNIDKAVNAYPAQLNDFYGELCSIYALSRGSVNVKLLQAPYSSKAYVCSSYALDNSDALQLASFCTPNSSDPYAQATTGVLSNPHGSLSSYQHQAQNNSISVRIPQYGHYISRANMDMMINEATPYYTASYNTSPKNVICFRDAGISPTVNTANPTDYYTIVRSGADDMNFGVFVSIPPMSLATGDVTT
jgi:hypothetical protein